MRERRALPQRARFLAMARALRQVEPATPGTLEEAIVVLWLTFNGILVIFMQARRPLAPLSARREACRASLRSPRRADIRAPCSMRARA